MTWRVEGAAALLKTSPYQMLGLLPDCAFNVIGLAVVPTALSVPLTVSSTRLMSSPVPMPSLPAICTTTPGSMVSATPGGTVRSPTTV